MFGFGLVGFERLVRQAHHKWFALFTGASAVVSWFRRDEAYARNQAWKAGIIIKPGMLAYTNPERVILSVFFAFF